jgi:hypothetical protein
MGKRSGTGFCPSVFIAKDTGADGSKGSSMNYHGNNGMVSNPWWGM